MHGQATDSKYLICQHGAWKPGDMSKYTQLVPDVHSILYPATDTAGQQNKIRKIAWVVLVNHKMHGDVQLLAGQNIVQQAIFTLPRTHFNAL